MEILKFNPTQRLIFVFEGLDPVGIEAAARLKTLTSDRKWLDDQNPELMVLGNGTDAYPMDYTMAETILDELIEAQGIDVTLSVTHAIAAGKQHILLVRLYEAGYEEDEDTGDQSEADDWS